MRFGVPKFSTEGVIAIAILLILCLSLVAYRLTWPEIPAEQPAIGPGVVKALVVMIWVLTFPLGWVGALLFHPEAPPWAVTAGTVLLAINACGWGRLLAWVYRSILSLARRDRGASGSM
jgi:hypothetical protein